jgi:hypothetical protein
MNANQNKERQTAGETETRRRKLAESDLDAYQGAIILRNPSA